MVLRSFSCYGGLELYAHKLVEGLLAEGYPITVVCEQQASNLKHENLTVVTFPPPSKRLSKVGRLNYYWNIVSAQMRELPKFDIVHSHHIGFQGHNVVTFHNHSVAHLANCGFAEERLLNQIKRQIVPAYRKREKIDQMLMHEADVLIFPSQVCRDDYKRHYGKAANKVDDAYFVAYPGASAPANLNQSASTRSARDCFTFLFVGRGYRKKGLDILLRACRILQARRLKFKLLIAGISATSINKLRLELLGVSQKIEFLGFRQDMAAVYARAQAIVLPSRYEPFGMAPIEGMLQGLVPIVAKVCGVSEVLNHGQDAIVVRDQLDADQLANAMERLITDEKFYDDLSKSAVVNAQSINWRNAIEVTKSAYRRALAADRRHQRGQMTTKAPLRQSNDQTTAPMAAGQCQFMPRSSGSHRGANV